MKFTFPSPKEKKPIALLGLNESGKTTILEGIYLIGKHCRQLANGDDAPFLSFDGRELQDIIPKPQVDESFFDGKIELSCTLQDRNHRRRFSFVYAIRNSTFEDFSVSVNGKDFKSMEEEGKEKAISLARQIPDILYYDDFKLEVPERITFLTEKGKKFYDDNPGEERPKDNPEWRHILKDVFKSLGKNKGKSFEEIYVDFLNTNKSSDAESMLKEAVSTTLSRHLDKKITKEWKKAQGRAATSLKKLLIEFKPQRPEGEGSFFSAIDYEIFAESNQEKRFRLAQRSKGCRWFFAFMLFTEFRKHRQKNTLFLLDEPASNLSAGMQEKVLSSIKGLTKGAEVIYATHSLYLMDLENFPATYVVENENSNSETTSPKITCHPLLEEDARTKIKKESIKPIEDLFRLSVPDIIPKIEKLSEEEKASVCEKILPGLSDRKKNLSALRDIAKSIASDAIWHLLRILFT